MNFEQLFLILFIYVISSIYINFFFMIVYKLLLDYLFKLEISFSFITQ